MLGEWEEPQKRVQSEHLPEPLEAKRGNGRCFYWGCVGPAWKPNPYMQNSPYEPHRTDPYYFLCSRHYEDSLRALERAYAVAAALEERWKSEPGKWERVEAPRGSRRGDPKLAATMRDVKIRERQEFLDRHVGERELLQEWKKKRSS